MRLVYYIYINILMYILLHIHLCVYRNVFEYIYVYGIMKKEKVLNSILKTFSNIQSG